MFGVHFSKQGKKTNKNPDHRYMIQGLLGPTSGNASTTTSGTTSTTTSGNNSDATVIKSSTIGTIYVLMMIILTITYLGGQIKQKRYKERDVIYLICMLTFSLFGFVGIRLAKNNVKIQIGITTVSAVAMLIANFVGYNIPTEK
jgi:hypothetical protein